jgi:hypothetical protein
MTTTDTWDAQACRFGDFLPEGLTTDRMVQVDAGLPGGGQTP